MAQLLKDLNIETGNLEKQFGLTKDDIQHMVKYQYENDFAKEGNPRDYNYDDCIRIFDSML